VRLTTLAVLVTAALTTFTATGCESELPVNDYCDPAAPTTKPSEEGEDHNTCEPCETNEECVTGGNPCCTDLHRWTCLHEKVADRLPKCEASCDLVPPNPGNQRCLCADGTCQAR